MFYKNCGTNLSKYSAKNSKEEKECIVFECKGNLQGSGVGKIVLTNKRIMLTKSKSMKFIIGCELSSLTKGDIYVKFGQILKIDTYIFLGGGGLQVYTNFGKSFRFDFKSSIDRDMTMKYIIERIN